MPYVSTVRHPVMPALGSATRCSGGRPIMLDLHARLLAVKLRLFRWRSADACFDRSFRRVRLFSQKPPMLREQTNRFLERLGIEGNLATTPHPTASLTARKAVRLAWPARSMTGAPRSRRTHGTGAFACPTGAHGLHREMPRVGLQIFDDFGNWHVELTSTR
jgi:hypothetical protein